MNDHGLWRGRLALAAAVVIWSVPAIFQFWLARSFDPWTQNFYRYAAGLLAITPFVVWGHLHRLRKVGARELAGCRALVTNDTGGMHLANAMGIPLLGLFGPTNPVRTGPIFAGSTHILQPPGCPPRGGWSLAALPPESVASALRQVLAAPESPLHSRLTAP